MNTYTVFTIDVFSMMFNCEFFSIIFALNFIFLFSGYYIALSHSFDWDTGKSHIYIKIENDSWYLHHREGDSILCSDKAELNKADRYKRIKLDELGEMLRGDRMEQLNDKEKNAATKEKEENKYNADIFDSVNNIQNFEGRLDFVITSINESRPDGFRINLEYLGVFLGLESVNVLEKYRNTTEAPSYQFEEMIADKLGISPLWLKSGYGFPFASIYSESDLKAEPFGLPDQEKAKKVFFAIKNVIDGKSLVPILKFNEFKYMVFPKEFIFYLSGGTNGEIELTLTYSMLRSLKRDGKMSYEAYMLSQSEWDDLLEGKIYPGTIERKQMDLDIIDIFISPNLTEISKYSEKYGQSFADAVIFIQNKRSQV